jgi:hypothetical protein
MCNQNPSLGQKAFLAFVILFGALQPAFYDADMMP